MTYKIIIEDSNLPQYKGVVRILNEKGEHVNGYYFTEIIDKRYV